jgi:hypothetical protein
MVLKAELLTNFSGGTTLRTEEDAAELGAILQDEPTGDGGSCSVGEAHRHQMLSSLRYSRSQRYRT